MLRQRQHRTTLYSFLVGCLATALALLAYGLAWLDASENRTLNWRFRYPHFNSIPFSPDLVSIDIDDTSLALVGRWPWPRDVQAALISVPARCGARAILVDLDWSERQTPRLDLPPDSDLVRLPLDQVALAESQTVDPDLELRAAIAEAPPVFPAFANFVRDRLEESPEFAAALRNLLQRNVHEVERLRQRMTSIYPPIPADTLNVADRLGLTALFVHRFHSSDATAAQDTSLPLHRVIEASLACRLAAMRFHFENWRSKNPTLLDSATEEVLDQFHEYVAARGYFESGPSPLKEAVALTVRNALSYRATLRPPLLSPELAQILAFPVQSLLPVHYLIAEPCRRPGFVNFQTDSDGVVRRETLFERHGDNQTVQLALAVACEVWGVEKITSGGRGRVRLEPPGRERVDIQLDVHGRIVVPWTTLGRMNAAGSQFVPAAKLCEVQTLEHQIDANAGLARAALKRIAAAPAMQEFRRIVELVDAVELAGARVRRARLELQPQTLAASREMLAEWQGKLAAEQARLIAHWSQRSAVSSQPDSSSLADDVALIAQIDRTNEKLTHDRDEVLAELRKRFEGRICLIGYTASALADMKPTPLAGSMPGVRAHLNLLNGLWVNRPLHWATEWQNASLATAAGVLISAVSALRRRWALPVLLACAVLLIGAVWGAFYWGTYWLAVVPALTAMSLSYVLVALFQFSFVDRERRELTKTLGQYTSATLARRMAEQPELCRRAETREVSSIFTDLEGFTTLSEEIGAERTQRLLNVSLGRLSEVLLRHEAMINKFIGDGIFAFWNPLIYPQPDHGVRACASALEMFDALQSLADERRAAHDDEAFSALKLRVGLAAGNAVVGPCGSEQKYDYTCIGDSVNLAARLESANKFFGTRVLANDRARELAGDAFAFRPLGRVQVKGKVLGVPVFELVGRRDALTAGDRDAIAQLEQALDHFQSRHFDAAQRSFAAILESRPADRAVLAYLQTTQRFLAAPPPADWNGALELTEK